MAQTGFTPIQLYSSSTATNVPLAANLANGELAINITDGKLFYKDDASAVQVIGWKTTPTSAGGTGLTSYTAGDTLYYATGTTLTKLAIGTAYQAFQVNAGATAPSWQASATSTLTTQGDLLYASAANTLARLAKNTSATRYLSNTGSSNNPAWAQIDLTNGVTGILPVANGGTNLSSFTANGVVYASSTSALATGSALTFDGTNLGIGTSSPTYKLDVRGQISSAAAYGGLFSVYDTLGASRVGYITTDAQAIGNNDTNLAIVAEQSGKGIKFYTSGATERARFNSTGAFVFAGGTTTANGIGITFPATQSASSNANTLDDYEEGTWTPSYTLGAGSATLNSASGSYVKIGKQVNLTLYISFSSATAAFINTITGFPFTSETASQLAVGALRESSNTGFMWLLQAGSNSTTAFIRKYDNTQALTAGDSFVGTLTYFTT